MVLVVAVVLVWGVVTLIGAVRGDDADPASSADSTPSAPGKSRSAVPTEPTDEPDPGLLPVSLSSGGAPCDPESVRITPTVPDGQQADGPVDVDLAISSTAASSCTLAPEDAGLVAVIGAGSSTVWDSTRCPTSLLGDPVDISARWATIVRVEWSGRRSGSGCSDDEPYAGAGDFVLKLGTLGGEPGEDSFSLDEQDDDEPTQDEG